MRIQIFGASCLLALILTEAQAQNSVGIGTTTPNNKAVLELVSPGGNQGLLVPRLTTSQRTSSVFVNSLQNSENGLLVFDSNDGQFYYWHNGQWQLILSGAGLTAGSGIDITGNTISVIPDGDGSATNELQNLSNTKTGSTVDLQISSGTGTSFSVNDSDADPTNEIQDLSLVGSTLSITNNPSATSINLSAFTGTNTDDQALSYNASTGQLTITGLSGGNNVTVTPAGTAGGVLSGSYPNPGFNLGAGNSLVNTLNNAATTQSILGSKLDPSVVLDTENLALGDLSGSFAAGFLIKADAITSSKILDGAIGTSDLANDAVTSAKILDGTVANTDIATDAITSAKILDGTVTGADILDGTVNTADVANNAINSVKILDGSVGSADVADGTIATVDLANDAVTSAKILDGTIATGDIANDAVTSAKILDGTVTSADILDGSIATGDVADGAITDVKLATGISPGKISPSGTNGQVLTTVLGVPTWASLPGTGTVTLVNTGTGLTGGPIVSTGTISVAANGISATELRSDNLIDANRAVTTNHIRDGAVSSAKITDNSIANADINSAAAIAVSKLGAGGNGEVLTVSAGVPTWAAPVDNSATNEIQTLSFSSPNLSISGGNAVNLSSINTDAQNLSFTSSGTNRTINISGGTGVTISVADNDNSSTNEIQGIESVLVTNPDANLQQLVNVGNLAVGDKITNNTNLYVKGSQSVGVTMVSAEPYDIKPNDYLIVVQGSTQNVILPDANDAIGRILVLRSVDAKGFFVQKKDPADKIDALDTVQVIDNVGQPNTITIVSVDKDQWLIINKSVKY